MKGSRPFITKLLAINAIIHGLLKPSGSSPGSFGGSTREEPGLRGFVVYMKPYYEALN